MGLTPCQKEWKQNNQTDNQSKTSAFFSYTHHLLCCYLPQMQQDALLRTSQEAAQWMQISNLSTSLSHFASLQQDDLDQAQDRVQVMSQEREHICA